MVEAPEEIRVREKGRILQLHYSDGSSISLRAEYLRVESPSAEVQGHKPDEKIAVPGKASVSISRLEPVGNYAMRIIFDDGHGSGLYTWTYLAELARDEQERWPRYLQRLSDEGLSR